MTNRNGLQFLAYKIDARVRLTYAVKYFLCFDDSPETCMLE